MLKCKKLKVPFRGSHVGMNVKMSVSCVKRWSLYEVKQTNAQKKHKRGIQKLYCHLLNYIAVFPIIKVIHIAPSPVSHIHIQMGDFSPCNTVLCTLLVERFWPSPNRPGVIKPGHGWILLASILKFVLIFIRSQIR